MYFSHQMGLMVQQTILGKVNLLLVQTHPLPVPLPCSNPPLAITTVVLETSLQCLLLLYLLTHHLLPSQPTVAPNINILLANLLVLHLPFPMPMPMTSCLCQMLMFLLAVRLALGFIMGIPQVKNFNTVPTPVYTIPIQPWYLWYPWVIGIKILLWDYNLHTTVHEILTTQWLQHLNQIPLTSSWTFLSQPQECPQKKWDHGGARNWDKGMHK